MTNAREAGRRAVPPLWALILALLLLLPALPALSPSALADEDTPEEKPDDTPDDDAGETEEPIVRAEVPWVRDVAAAKEQAAKEGKDLFIDFTGSDWCGWCHRLEDEVLTHASFVEAAKKDFVFLYLDFPRGDEKKAQVVDPELNEKLKESLGVEGFPTIILATASGEPYGRTGYQEGGPEAYLENLAHLREAGQAVKKLIADAKHEDTEVLKAAFPVLAENELLGYAPYDWTLAAVEKLDPKGDLDLLPLVQAERERRLEAAEWTELEKLFPEPGQEPDRDAIITFIKASKYLAGPQFLNMVLGLTNWLLNEGRPQDAKALLARGAQDPLAQVHPQAIQIFEQMNKRADEMIAGPADDDDTGDDDGMDEPDEDDGDDGDGE